jgi:hypothetical protein
MFVALPGRRVVKLHPVLTFVVADTPEMAALTLTTASNKSPRPDPSSLVTKERLDDRWAALLVLLLPPPAPAGASVCFCLFSLPALHPSVSCICHCFLT